MKVVLQRVSKASVTVDGKKVASIKKGLLILFLEGEEETEHYRTDIWDEE